MKLWPARSKVVSEKPVVDLDEIVSDDVHFRFNGKIHALKRMDFQTFLQFTNARNELHNAAESDEKMTARQLAERYHKVLSPMCSTISVDDILGMEQVQVAALYQLVIDLVTGQVDMGDGKKKRQKIPLYDSVQPSSSPSARESSAGQPGKH